MTDAQFLNAVALGQVTPGPVVATVAGRRYAAHGLGGGLLAAAVAFAPSFSFVLLAGDRFERLRRNATARAFLEGAGPAAIGAILGAAVALAGVLDQPWQAGVLAAATIALLLLRRGVVETLVVAGAVARSSGSPAARCRRRRQLPGRRWPGGSTQAPRSLDREAERGEAAAP